MASGETHEQLFRRESGRMVVALTRIFGVHNLTLAQDVVQDAFCRALAAWQVQGMPDNPSAWLMTTAKHRALDIVRRERTARTFAPELGRLLSTEWTLEPVVDEAFAAPVLHDEQLRMMFSCCHPKLAEEVQLALILNILCGFGAAEIAALFLVGQAAVEKRIARGKQVLARTKTLFALVEAHGSAREPDHHGAFDQRLSTVLHALYLLFSQGYHGASARAPVRVELCDEALRLVLMLLTHAPAATPRSHALAALMCLHAARLPARLDAGGELSALADQDRSHWDAALAERGLDLFERAITGQELSAYHIEAAIAATHLAAGSLAATDWPAIVSLYDQLLTIRPSPVIALNRAIAVGQCDGPERGIAELLAIEGRDQLAGYPFYPAALAELELVRGNRDAARVYFQSALEAARNDAERRFLARRLAGLADA